MTKEPNLAMFEIHFKTFAKLLVTFATGSGLGATGTKDIHIYIHAYMYVIIYIRIYIYIYIVIYIYIYIYIITY